MAPLLLVLSQAATTVPAVAQSPGGEPARAESAGTSAAASTESAALAGYWTVTVEGESRRREMVLHSFAARGGHRFWAAGYGWADAGLDPVPVKVASADGKLTLELKTPASALIQASIQLENEMTGTFAPRAGFPKAITLKRTGPATLRDSDRFAEEAKDFGVAPTKSLTTTYHAKTPLSVPGASTITTPQLWTWLTSDKPPVILDVLDGEPGKRHCLPGAVWSGSRFGQGQVFANDQRDFAGLLKDLTAGDKAAPIVFYCLNPECWLSYNAVLRAMGEGYTNVHWYRGGLRAWQAARLPTVIGELYRP